MIREFSVTDDKMMARRSSFVGPAAQYTNSFAQNLLLPESGRANNKCGAKYAHSNDEGARCEKREASRGSREKG